MPTTGVATHTSGSWATTTTGTFSIGTIPPGSYGTNPTLIVIFAAGWQNAVADQSWALGRSMRVDNNASGSVALTPGVGFGGSPAQGGGGTLRTMATGFLDSGATVKVVVSATPPATLQDCGTTATAVVTYDVGDERDATNSWYSAAGFDYDDPVVGSFSTVPFLGGTYGIVGPQFALYGKQVRPDPTCKLAAGVVSTSVDYNGPVPITFSGSNWTQYEGTDFTSSLGSNFFRGSAAIAVWRLPDPLDTSYNVASAGLPFSNGARDIFALNNALVVQALGHSFAQVIG